LATVGTVTLNPALDRTVALNSLRLHTLNRADSVRVDAAGKGINVARVLTRLGHSSVCLGFLAGDTGRTVATLVEREGLPTDFLWVGGETRTNLKLVEYGGLVTEVNERGPLVTEQDLDALAEQFQQRLNRFHMAVVAGSAPAGVSPGYYARLVSSARQAGVPVALDAEGEALEAGLSAGPDLVKPNADEAARLAGARPDTLSEAAEVAAILADRGVRLALVSMGALGCAYATRDEYGWAEAPAVAARSTVGAGDSLVAGTVASLLEKRPPAEAVRWGVAIAASAVRWQGPGRPDPGEVAGLLSQTAVRTTRRQAPKAPGPARRERIP